MSEAQSVIASLYLPMAGDKLLLPNVSVAEVVGYQEPVKSPGTPDHYLGLVRWRGIDVPLICFELANRTGQYEHAPGARIAVINTIGEQTERIPFFALLTQGIPRLIKVSSELIKEGEKPVGPAESLRVRVDGEDAIIPNIDYLETLVYQQTR
jgi:chemosensory pili system protein ChpC